MLVVHVHVLGRHGAVERTYDFVRNDGKEALDGCDIVIPYNGDEYTYPLSEDDTLAIIHHKSFTGEH